MKQEIVNKILRSKIIWIEIKANEQEYSRLQKQIDELEKAKKDISFDVQKRLNEAQKISEYLLEQETKYLIENNL